MRRRTSSQAATTGTTAPVPRDVEAVGAAIDRLIEGITSDTHGHQVIVETLVAELRLGYGSAWLPAEDGAFLQSGEFGPLVPGVAAGPGSRVTSITLADGFGGEAIRTRKTLVLEADADPGRCLRWRGALQAGATSGCLLPVLEDG